MGARLRFFALGLVRLRLGLFNAALRRFGTTLSIRCLRVMPHHFRVRVRVRG